MRHCFIKGNDSKISKIMRKKSEELWGEVHSCETKSTQVASCYCDIAYRKTDRPKMLALGKSRVA